MQSVGNVDDPRQFQTDLVSYLYHDGKQTKIKSLIIKSVDAFNIDYNVNICERQCDVFVISICLRSNTSLFIYK